MEAKDTNVQERPLTTEQKNTSLYVEVSAEQWPIIYHSTYNIKFLGMEKLHPFDSAKWGNIHNFLKEEGMLTDDSTVRPEEASESDLLVVHTKRYLKSLQWSANVARITEVPPVACVPNFIVQRKVLKPFRLQTGGTVLGAKLAWDRGWAINIGGGFHHCSSDQGGGFCAYADITLAIHFFWRYIAPDKKVMIIDLDAHQGNGHERDFMNNESVYILDVYNRSIYPHDGFAKRAIRKKIELNCWVEDQEYLARVRRAMNEALAEFSPDFVVYNAGTDILDGDPLGCLCISDEGIVARDQLVFETLRAHRLPLLMVTSGGYQRKTARIIANSVLNLWRVGLVDRPDLTSSM